MKPKRAKRYERLRDAVVIRRACDMISIGGTLSDVCAMLALKLDNVKDALKQPDHPFSVAYVRANAEGKQYFLRSIRSGAAGDWRAAAWWLERRYPKTWAERTGEAVPIEVRFAVPANTKRGTELPVKRRGPGVHRVELTTEE